MFYTLHINQYRRIYVYEYTNQNNEIIYSLGMTSRHKSCLVLKAIDNYLYISALSTRKKYTQTLKNPLGIGRNDKHMATWLYIAKVFAHKQGYKSLKLYDAANIRFPETFCFLSAITLLKENTFVYNKYGFTTYDPRYLKVLSVLIERVPQDLIECTNHLQLKMILRKSTSWQDVYKRLEHFKLVYLCEHIIELFGFDIKELQFYYTYDVSNDNMQCTNYSYEILKEVPHWLQVYSDRYMDVF